MIIIYDIFFNDKLFMMKNIFYDKIFCEYCMLRIYDKILFLGIILMMMRMNEMIQ